MMRFIGWLFLCVTFSLLLTGCGSSTNESPKEEVASNLTNPEWTATDVLNNMFAAYSEASSYSDKAVLYMTYRTSDGRPMQEPMPWSVNYQKSTQRFSGQFFDSVVRYDGEMLGCRVFDIQSDNQDNQFLLIPGATLPFDQLLSDQLARRFVGGFEEVPLRAGHDALIDALLPPTVKLLTGQADFPWFTRPESVTRLEDQTVEGIVCYHVKSTYHNQTCEVWIEQESGLIHQLLYPNAIFSDEVTQTNRVQDLKVVGRFHNCQFNTTIDAQTFVVEPPETASLVTEFVTLPEAFPSELIGQKTPKFQLRLPAGQEVSNDKFRGKPTAFLWIASFAAEEGIRKFDELNRRFANELNFGVLYSDAEMAAPEGSSYQLSESFLQSLGVAPEVPFYCDHHLDMAALLQIKAIPSVLIVDEEMKIQYARALSGEEWAEEIEAAIERVKRGEDIAQEMIDEYGKFYSAYRAKLHSVAFDQKSIRAQTASATIRSGAVKQLWSDDSLLQPGNIASHSAEGVQRIAVLDGYRTVVLFDENGNQLVRRELDLPENQAVTRIRLSDFQGEMMLAVFSKLGSQVHWFDDQLQPIGRYPSSPKPALKITDCRFAKNGESLGLLVAIQDQGFHQVDLATGVSKRLSEENSDEFSISGNLVAGINHGQPFVIGQGELEPSQFSNWRFTDLEGATEPSSNSKVAFCSIGSNDGQWQAVGFDSKLGFQWKSSIGDQDFASDIEPLVRHQESGTWLIANSDYGVNVFNDAGDVIGLLRVDLGIRGLAVLHDTKNLNLIYSEGRRIKCVQFRIQ